MCRMGRERLTQLTCASRNCYGATGAKQYAHSDPEALQHRTPFDVTSRHGTGREHDAFAQASTFKQPEEVGEVAGGELGSGGTRW